MRGSIGQRITVRTGGWSTRPGGWPLPFSGWIFLASHYFCSKRRLSSVGTSSSETGKTEMTKVRNKTLHQEKTFTLDGKFLRDEAREAVRSYLSPFAGI